VSTNSTTRAGDFFFVAMWWIHQGKYQFDRHQKNNPSPEEKGCYERETRLELATLTFELATLTLAR
jgi:hypothetical protein